MLFSDSIPQAVLNHPNASRFLQVLDNLLEFKRGAITDAHRTYNPALCTNSKWLSRYLSDFGITHIPDKFPIFALQQLALNADTLLGLKGSLEGVTLLCAICSFGKVTIDTSDFIKKSLWLYPDSLIDGIITGSSVESTWRYLVNTNEVEQQGSLGITIKSKLFNGNYAEEAAAVQEFLTYMLERYLGFKGNSVINIQYQSDNKFYYHHLQNPFYLEENIEVL